MIVRKPLELYDISLDVIITHTPTNYCIFFTSLGVPNLSMTRYACSRSQDKHACTPKFLVTKGLNKITKNRTFAFSEL